MAFMQEMKCLCLISQLKGSTQRGKYIPAPLAVEVHHCLLILGIFGSFQLVVLLRIVSMSRLF